jgi:ornithine carbamoyltransferase
MMAATPRHVLSVGDLTAATLAALLERSMALKRAPRTTQLAQHTLALIFEKPSLRTRVSFEVAMQELGGNCLVLRQDEIQMGQRESVEDIAAYLSRNVTVAALRVFAHSTLTRFAAAASIPVVNALSDWEHPCQALADVLTVRAHCGRLAGVRLAYVGDGNNVCHSLLLAGALGGMHMRVACPAGYAPQADVVEQARARGAAQGATIEIGHDPVAAVRGADAVYTDVWASMGQEQEAAERQRHFMPFQVNEPLMAHAPDAIVLHCLPAHRGEEITDAVIDSPRAVVFDQAENRRHAQKAVLLYVLGML